MKPLAKSVGKLLFDIFSIQIGLQQADALSPLFFNFTLEYDIRNVQVKQFGLKLTGTHQLLFYADDDNLLGDSLNTIQWNSETLLEASSDIGLEINAEKTNYMIMSHNQNSGKNQNIRITNELFENKKKFKCLKTTLTNHNDIQDEIKCRLNSESIIFVFLSYMKNIKY